MCTIRFILLRCTVLRKLLHGETDMKKKLRIVVDIGMVLLLPLLMAYSLVGEAAHEYLGIGMFLLFIVHHILNLAWWKHLLRGRYTPFRILGAAVNLALAVIMLAYFLALHYRSTTRPQPPMNKIEPHQTLLRANSIRGRAPTASLLCCVQAIRGRAL